MGDTNLLSLGDPDANVGGVRVTIDQTGTTSVLGNATLNLKGNTVNIDNDAGGTAKISLLGNVTASANISASGTIFTNTLSSPSNNLAISSSTVTITSTTDNEANLILEADTDNNDENDNPFMSFK